MITITGKYNTAVCYTSNLEEMSSEQIKTLCDQEVFADCKISIMPDVHAGKGCTIGTTMTIKDKIVPGMVGVDIGCGMETARVNADEIDFARLDKIIHEYVPAGFNIRERPHEYNDKIDLSILRCAGQVNTKRARKSIGTLGGGNHFIEVARCDNGELYIIVHSGSRNIGNEVAEYYQTLAYDTLRGCAQHQINNIIEQFKETGRENEIQTTIKQLKKQTDIPVPKDLAYVEGLLFDDYIHDMKLIQHFAVLNRKAIMDVILVGMRLSVIEDFTTIHNYIDTDSMILRKGAVSAKAREKILIPINMRDGSLICIGKGNPDWNYSAPHGAGRLMSRKKAMKELSMEQFKKEMTGIYSTCVLTETLDESPMAYKPIDEIIENINDTAEIVKKIKPLYNFKASEQGKRRKYK